MILTDNINYLKKCFPDVWQKLKNIDPMESGRFEVATSKTKNHTLVVNTENGQSYIHSKYDPVREAEQIIGQYKDVNHYKHVIFYGVGLGYHIQEFVKKHPKIPFSIFEPSADLLSLFLSETELKKFSSSLKEMYLFYNEYELTECMKIFFNKGYNEVLFIPLPSYERLFNKEYRQFQSVFKQIANDKILELRTNLAFEKYWIVNSLKNFMDVVTTPNILHMDDVAFKDKPVIMVAAGPSLEDEIELIRHVKQHRLAYIFSIGSAINALLANNIIPDAACTYDPTPLNKKVFQTIINDGIREVPLIFGSSVGYETIENYPGPKIHMLINQDSISAQYLKRKDKEPISMLSDAPSIAVVTLQLLQTLGCSPIILVGQNFAYRDNKHYSKGIEYDFRSSSLTEQEKKESIVVDDVEGNKVHTSPALNKMRTQMEAVIKTFDSANIINTTKNGAMIEGTTYLPLQTVIEHYLTEPIVNKDWLKATFAEYDLNYAVQQSYSMESELEKLKNTFVKIESLLKNMNDYINKRTSRKLEQSFTTFDDLFEELQTNKFYLITINRMSRVHFGKIMQMFEQVRSERNVYLKAQRVIDEFGAFMENCKMNMIIIEPIVQKMHTELRSYAENENTNQ